MTVLRYYTMYKTYTEMEILKKWHINQGLLNTVPLKYRYYFPLHIEAGGSCKCIPSPPKL